MPLSQLVVVLSISAYIVPNIGSSTIADRAL